jgi:hypothetical protein
MIADPGRKEQWVDIFIQSCIIYTVQSTRESVMKKVLFALVAVLGFAASVPAFAHHGGVQWHVVIGIPCCYQPTYVAQPVYQPQVVYVQAPQPALATQPPVPTFNTAPAPEPQYWYYCAKSKGYYPYVRTCPTGWQKVSAMPPQ